MLDVIVSAVTQLVIGHADERPFTLITFDTAAGHVNTYPSEFGGTGLPCPITNRYVTRFGDECCGNCHVTLRWSPQWVRDGLYGDDTAEWTTATLDAFVARFVRAEQPLVTS